MVKGVQKSPAKKPALPVMTGDFESFAEHLNTYFVAVDEKGIVQYINSAYAKALGYKKTELIGRHIYEFLLEYNSDGEYQWNRIPEAMGNTADIPLRTQEIRCKNGDTIWVESRSKLGMLAEKNIRIAYGSIIDVTEQKRRIAADKQNYQFASISAFINNAVKNHYEFAELFQYLASIGITMKQPIVVFVFKKACSTPCATTNEEKSNEWKRWTLPLINEAAAGQCQVIWETPVGLAMLLGLTSITDADDQINTIIAKISNQLQSAGNAAKILVGVSDTWDRPGSISTPVAEAEESIRWGIVMHPGKACYYWKNLGIGQLLLSLTPLQATQFYTQKIGPLLTLPAANQGELMQTLCEILSSKSVTDSANRLHVHPKTIAYRRTILEKLLSVDFDDPTTRTDLFIAMRLFQMYGNKESETRLP